MQVFVKSFGCATSLADGETLAGCLAAAGYDLVTSVQAADVIVYNTCAVKGPTENRMIETLKRVPANKKLIVAGCLPPINFERLSREVLFDGAVGPAIAENIAEIVRRVANGEKVVDLQDSVKVCPSLDLPHMRLNPVISIIPIGYGCLGSCAYCCVALARGRLRSHGIEEIVERAKTDLASGARELWITSQDTACYGKDRRTDLAELITALCNIGGDFKVRVGMMTPNNAMVILDDLAAAFADKHVFKFVHLPVQTGDDEILSRMQRHYSANDFKSIVETLRDCLSGLTLSTDIICGFPGESNEAFAKTLDLIEEIKPDVVNVSKFFARPKTAAAEMQRDFLPPKEISQRSKSAAAVVKKIGFERKQKLIGWTGEILVDEVGKIPGSWIGRNFAYQPIAIETKKELLGKTLKVKVKRAFFTHLEGEIIE
ncbi:MAG TPA: tRNA (N(6)-L-threonylcarbamoyladenosine(37)-C(2))-methylthiotransferase [Candidatus Acidoferrum sp.]|nr:tRNA (N(6)-L-threonylcarbamoyladenosine(37)-C(2))-methylthiotransferase [Candidatus Acidoferrum sp.]